MGRTMYATEVRNFILQVYPHFAEMGNIVLREKALYMGLAVGVPHGILRLWGV